MQQSDVLTDASVSGKLNKRFTPEFHRNQNLLQNCKIAWASARVEVRTQQPDNLIRHTGTLVTICKHQRASRLFRYV